MRPPRSVILMYHRVSVAGALPAEGDYALSKATFEEQVRWLAGRGPAVVPLRDLAARKASRDSVVLTFDDGCETDATVAAPLLSELGLCASFFVNPETVGRPGFVSWDQLRELVRCGFEVGSHGLTHRLFADLTIEELTHQLEESKSALEGHLDCPVESVSLPGGSGGRRALETALGVGYRRVLGSRPGIVSDARAPRVLPRFAVRRGHGAAAFRRMVEGALLTRWRHVARFLVASGGRSLLGVSRYERLRADWLAARSASHRTER